MTRASIEFKVSSSYAGLCACCESGPASHNTNTCYSRKEISHITLHFRIHGVCMSQVLMCMVEQQVLVRQGMDQRVSLLDNQCFRLGSRCHLCAVVLLGLFQLLQFFTCLSCRLRVAQPEPLKLFYRSIRPSGQNMHIRHASLPSSASCRLSLRVFHRSSSRWQYNLVQHLQQHSSMQ